MRESRAGHLMVPLLPTSSWEIVTQFILEVSRFVHTTRDRRTAGLLGKHDEGGVFRETNTRITDDTISPEHIRK